MFTSTQVDPTVVGASQMSKQVGPLQTLEVRRHPRSGIYFHVHPAQDGAGVVVVVVVVVVEPGATVVVVEHVPAQLGPFWGIPLVQSVKVTAQGVLAFGQNCGSSQEHPAVKQKALSGTPPVRAQTLVELFHVQLHLPVQGLTVVVVLVVVGLHSVGVFAALTSTMMRPSTMSRMMPL